MTARLFGSRKYSRAIEFRIIRRWLGEHRGLVLDLGCGDGEFAIQLEQLGYRVVGLDLAAGELSEARTVSGLGDRWVCGDATNLPFPAGSFDLVLSNSVIEHIPDDGAVFAEVARVLKPGCPIILTTDTFPDRISRWLALIPSAWRRPDFRGNTDLAGRMRASHQRRHAVARYYTPDTLASRLGAAGLTVDRVQPYMNGFFTGAIFELHLLLSSLDLYNGLSRRLYPLFYPFTFAPWGRRVGYGLAVRAGAPR